MSKKIILEDITSKNKRMFIATTIISSAVYVEGEGRIKITFAPVLKPYFLGLKGHFTQYQLKNILKLKGSHSIRIYELLKQKEGLRKREFEVDRLKELLGVSGDYERFYDFERRVLKPAKAEINEKTDIWITYKKIKKGRNIDKLIFEIETKYGEFDQQTEGIRQLKKNGIIDIDSIKKMTGMTECKFSDKQILVLYEIAVQKTDSENIDVFEYIRLNYIYTIEKETVRNKYSYLIKAIEEDYAKAVAQLKIIDRYAEKENQEGSAISKLEKVI